jgi:hypothetical protein
METEIVLLCYRESTAFPYPDTYIHIYLVYVSLLMFLGIRFNIILPLFLYQKQRAP